MTLDSGLTTASPLKLSRLTYLNYRVKTPTSMTLSITKKPPALLSKPGSYTVLIYRRPVLRHKSEQTVTTAPAPDNVLDGCYADVSLLAGIMVDKGVYHLPLYRQHQRMLNSGIQVSRATLTNWIQKSIELLTPIYQAMLKHILQSQVLAMDEVPMKAGRKSKAGRSPGQMKQTYFWPIYGEDDEVAFIARIYLRL